MSQARFNGFDDGNIGEFRLARAKLGKILLRCPRSALAASNRGVKPLLLRGDHAEGCPENYSARRFCALNQSP